MILNLDEYYNIYLREKSEGRFNTYYFNKDFIKNYGIISFSVCGINHRDCLNVNTDFFQRKVKVKIDNKSTILALNLICYGDDYINGNHNLSIFYDDLTEFSYLEVSEDFSLYNISYHGDYPLYCLRNSNIRINYRIFESYNILLKNLNNRFDIERGNKVYYDKLFLYITSFTKQSYMNLNGNKTEFLDNELKGIECLLKNWNYGEFIIYDETNFHYGDQYLRQLFKLLNSVSNKNIVYCFGVNNNQLDINKALEYFNWSGINYLIFDKNDSIPLGKNFEISKLVRLV